MPATKELVASNRSDEEVAKEIGADKLIYQSLDDLIQTVHEGNPKLKNLKPLYLPVNISHPLKKNYLEELEETRSNDQRLQKKRLLKG